MGQLPPDTYLFPAVRRSIEINAYELHHSSRGEVLGRVEQVPREIVIGEGRGGWVWRTPEAKGWAKGREQAAWALFHRWRQRVEGPRLAREAEAERLADEAAARAELEAQMRAEAEAFAQACPSSDVE